MYGYAKLSTLFKYLIIVRFIYSLIRFVIRSLCVTILICQLSWQMNSLYYLLMITIYNPLLA